MAQKFRRRIIREKVLQVLFAYDMNQDSLQYSMDEILAGISNKPDKEFANDLINRTLKHIKEFDEIIQGRVNNWEINRIALIDRILLRMGICELLYFPDIPPKVTINESIEIAKECGGIRSCLVLLIMSILAGRLFLKTTWSRFALVLAIFPIAILQNGLRITTLCVLGIYVHGSFLTSETHYHMGDVYFVLALLLLFLPTIWWLRSAEKRIPTVTHHKNG